MRHRNVIREDCDHALWHKNRIITIQERVIMRIYQKIRKISVSIIAMMIGVAALLSEASAQARIKDLVSIEGIRDNQLVGYGLVVGLNGTGDDLDSAVFTQESIIGMLRRLGVNARNTDLETDNTAAVIVTATLRPFAQNGDRLDVNVSALGDASSLIGGTLLVTPLLGADGEVYAVAQGTVIVPGYNADGQAEEGTRNVQTNGRVISGAIVEREVPFNIVDRTTVNMSLHTPDFTTARRIASGINSLAGLQIASVVSPGEISVTIMQDTDYSMIDILTDVEQLRIHADQIAKVVIDEQNGVVVIGSNVRVSNVGLSHGNLSVEIASRTANNVPLPFINASLRERQLAEEQVQEEDSALIDDTLDQTSLVQGNIGVLQDSVSLQELVTGLNALG
ncbi:MAG: flagellar basal body P-ring protein FlgI, partial [Pseudomonadota bacterium]